MLILGVFKLAATVVSYSSGSSGGIFGPSLYIGGMLGGVVGVCAAAATGNPVTQPGAFVLVGMGAVFAGIVRAPITSIVIIFEMTNNYSVILPLMAANITSYAIARRLSPMPIYDALLMQDGLHLPRPGGHPLEAGPSGRRDDPGDRDPSLQIGPSRRPTSTCRAPTRRIMPTRSSMAKVGSSGCSTVRRLLEH